MKAAKVWLCRDDDGDYAVCPPFNEEPEPVKHPSGFWYLPSVECRVGRIRCREEDFEHMFPHLKLKPGEGPVRVELTAKFVD